MTRLSWTRYRVVRDRFAGYEAQYRRWWSPFWWMVGGVNSRANLEDAVSLCREDALYKGGTIYLGRLPTTKEVSDV